MTTLLDTLRTLEVNAYGTFLGAVLGRLLIAAGQPEQGRVRLYAGLQLARDTGMHFYDAELLPLRTHTHTDPDARNADIAAARELAHHQDANLFELRAALDDFDLRGPIAKGIVQPRRRRPTCPVRATVKRHIYRARLRREPPAATNSPPCYPNTGREQSEHLALTACTQRRR